MNEDLAEAICMGHDIGHTPFGHAGEEALNKKLERTKHKGFCHNENGVRRIIETEDWGEDWNTGKKRYGINPTYELAEGILKHTDRSINEEKYKKFKPKSPATLEGQVVAFADEISTRYSDLQDSVYSDKNIIDKEDHNILLKDLFGTIKVNIIKEYMKNVYNEFIQNEPKDRDDLLERKYKSIKFF